METTSNLRSQSENLLEDLFHHEIGKSARLRAIILIGLLSFVGISLLLVYLFFGEQYIDIFESNIAIYALIIYALVIIGYELLVHYLVKAKSEWFNLRSKFSAYFTTFSEISLLSVLLIVVVERSEATVILSSPAVLTYFILIILSTLHLDFKLSIFAGLLAAITYVAIVINYSYFNVPSTYNNVSLSTIQYLGQSIMMITAGISAGFVARLIKSKMSASLNTIIEKNAVIDLFGQQISQQVVHEILENPKELTGTRKNVTIMFLDIRNFTPFVENKEPEEVVNYLNIMFGFMIDIVQSHHGIINQFLGDGFMATFGSPIAVGNSSEHAAMAAQEILTTLKNKIEQEEIRATRLGIGIHFGEAVTGNIGSTARKQYSITGNVVILASRIEQLNKKFNSQLLISEEVHLQLDPKIKDMYVALGSVNVKGREKPISIYQLKESHE
ncbi:MAG: adenylate/guanylate cyclase domain-containing protein [Cyclobacteriaceae bacterium]|nr:adenylate/guanylate cyclase domain-containing protein [Cyclobacteriaceae bacterium]